MSTPQKAVNDLITAHKVGFTMLPLLEALSDNLRESGIDNVKFKNAFATITQRASSTFHYLVKTLNLPSDKQNALMSKLMVVYANVLANEILLYGNDNITMFDDVFKEFIIENEVWLFPDVAMGGDIPVPEYDLNIAKSQASMTLLNSVWVFHNNLYIGGLIKGSQLAIMNNVATEYLLKMLNYQVEATYSNNKEASDLKPVFWIICASVMGKAMVQFEERIIKSEDDLKSYIADPSPFFSKLQPLLQANLASASHMISAVVGSISK